jgi:hypothetical protein
MNNNEVGCQLLWGGQTLKSLMYHIMVGDYPHLRYPNFLPKKGGSGCGSVSIREPSPPRGHLCLVQPKPEWQVPPEYAMAAHQFRHADGQEEYPGQHATYTRLPGTQVAAAGGLRLVLVGEGGACLLCMPW